MSLIRGCPTGTLRVSAAEAGGYSPVRQAQSVPTARVRQPIESLLLEGIGYGVSEGIRTPNIRSHSPALYP